MAKNSDKRIEVMVPQSQADAAEFVAQIALAQRAINAINDKLNAEVDRLKTKAMKEAEPWQGHITDLQVGLFAYAENNRDALTEGGKTKTVKLPTGSIGWRMGPPSIKLTGKKAVLAALKALRWNRFIRVTEDVDKEAMLKEPDVAERVSGVQVVQNEFFVVKPDAEDVEIEGDVRDLRKVIRKL